MNPQRRAVHQLQVGDVLKAVSLGPHRSWTSVLRTDDGSTINISGRRVQKITTDMTSWKLRLQRGVGITLPFRGVLVRISD